LLLQKELNENTDKSTKFWLKVWQDWALGERIYDVINIEKYPILSTNQMVTKLVRGSDSGSGSQI
jgi:hypothetical protein